ncbi:uncharacterized protein MELLADRAFT_109475 [Melampsora larici-populina 98AG31]|uniref:Uncharacterized protein n=1 Tax=Melampsora larici-populina (strain 98AG31 / pathotype 3-4-7) TaxID=747676 RepID=F4RWL4_MELLP|nr:uncharacterized protein MELLADRAFT_109475 [Melampsora larici-populina 98AG31]EGG03056.1 hypothetical protein MELLADRAFT_109475 [Melampsora larici-populina 98AG31]
MTTCMHCACPPRTVTQLHLIPMTLHFDNSNQNSSSTITSSQELGSQLVINNQTQITLTNTANSEMPPCQTRKPAVGSTNQPAKTSVHSFKCLRQQKASPAPPPKQSDQTSLCSAKRLCENYDTQKTSSPDSSDSDSEEDSF